MTVIRNRMARELNSVQPDREQLSRLAEALGERHKDLKIITFDYYFNMLSVLEPGQSEKLATYFQSMLSAPGPGQRYGGERHRNKDN
jgi:Spy/CpxP family protein refolding chaperone